MLRRLGFDFWFHRRLQRFDSCWWRSGSRRELDFLGDCLWFDFCVARIWSFAGGWARNRIPDSSKIPSARRISKQIVHNLARFFSGFREDLEIYWEFAASFRISTALIIFSKSCKIFSFSTKLSSLSEIVTLLWNFNDSLQADYSPAFTYRLSGQAESCVLVDRKTNLMDDVTSISRFRIHPFF